MVKHNLKIENNIQYIKSDGVYYYPQEPYIQDPKMIDGIFKPVCYIKKMSFGRYCIELYNGVPCGKDSAIPNYRIILYPSGIEEIGFTLS